MFRVRFTLFCLIAAFAAVGCSAQVPPAGKDASAADEVSSANAKLDRKIEVVVRSQLGVPSDWNVVVGPRTKTETPGYDALTITFSPVADPSRKESMDFLLSKDGNTLARLSKWDLTKNLSDTISTMGRPIRGDEGAKVTIVNYDDLECPYCARMHAELFPQTLDHYKGLVKIVYKDDPLTEIHPWALHAAVDANCLASVSPSAYWAYVDYLHTHGEDVSGPERDPAKSIERLDKAAREQAVHGGADTPALDACLAKQDDRKVRASMKEAGALGVDGTPTLFINGERISGARPIADVWATIDRALRAEGITPPPNSAAAAAPSATTPSPTPPSAPAAATPKTGSGGER